VQELPSGLPRGVSRVALPFDLLANDPSADLADLFREILYSFDSDSPPELGEAHQRHVRPQVSLPRIPFAPDFRAFAKASKQLADLHLNYEQAEPYPLKHEEADGVPYSPRVADKMRLSKDKTSLRVNDSLTLAGIPAAAFDYRLGNRSALEWVIDQYRVTEDKRSGIKSDPNRPDDPEYIVRLVGQVVRVSVETVRIVAGLPATFTRGGGPSDG
jgi:predicted helicase